MSANQPGQAAQRGTLTWARFARWIWSAALVVIWANWLVIIGFSALLVTTRAYDFNVYYAAAEALRLNHLANIYGYQALVHMSSHVGGGYVYPPLLAMVLEPLTLEPVHVAATIWLLLNAALWAVSTLALGRTLAGRWALRYRLAAYTLISLLSLTFWQAYAGLYLGQVHLLLLCGMCLAIQWRERQRDWLAGSALMVVAVIKFFPAALLIYYLARRRWRLLAGAALMCALLLVVMVVGTSPATLASSVPAAFISVQGQATPGLNEALMIVTPAGRELAALVGIAFLAVVLLRGGDDLLGVGWACCTMLLISPLVWAFYLIWLLPAFCACLAALGARRWATSGAPSNGSATPRLAWQSWRTRSGWIVVALLLASLYVVLAYPLSFTLRPVATLALWAFTGALYWRSGARASRDSSDNLAARRAPNHVTAAILAPSSQST